MKYQRILLAALSANAVFASPLKKADDGQCPLGYSMSVYYITVTATPPVVASTTTTTTAEPSFTSSSTSTIVEVTAASESIENTASAVEATTAPESSTTAPTEEVNVQSQATTSTAVTTSESQLTTITTTTTSTTITTTTTTAAAAATATPTSSSSDTQGTTNSGEATFYGGNVSGGTCSFSGYTLPSNLFGTALSGARWDDAAQCGSCVAVTGPSGNTIKAMVVDKCPECESNHLDLFENAFAQLANTAEGVISIDWSYVSCDIDSPFILKNKEGTSQYWFSMQVVNANEPVVSLEVSTDGGSTWQSTTRSFYNYFENSTGFGTETVDVRVTGQSGKSIVVKDVGCSSEASKTASGNF